MLQHYTASNAFKLLHSFTHYIAGGTNAYNYITFVVAILTLVVNINNNINNNNNNLNQFNLNIADNNNANANVNNNNANVVNVMPPGRKKRADLRRKMKARMRRSTM